MKKFPGWFGGSGRSSRRSKKDTLTCPLRRDPDVRLELVGVGDVLVDRVGVLHVVPPSSELMSLMSACMPSSSPGGERRRVVVGVGDIQLAVACPPP